MPKIDKKDPNCPIEYIQGFAYFCNSRFYVNQNVLIPRIETEQIIELVVNYAKKVNTNTLNICEVGTGSGCISITLAIQLPNACITATDISEKALEIAVKNAREHKVLNRINFVNHNLVPTCEGALDIIVANLPYLPSDKIVKLDASVKDFEPITALDGGSDGFDIYRKLFKQVSESKVPPKVVIIEIDEKQGSLALAEAKKYFMRDKPRVIKDKYGYDRFLVVGLL